MHEQKGPGVLAGITKAGIGCFFHLGTTLGDRRLSLDAEPP
jgi:hypothetical protein